MDEKILNRLIAINLLLYVLGCFISGETNPSKWMLFSNWVGRFLFVVVEYFTIVKFPTLIEKLNK
jgi:hypothetical protein